VDLTHDGRGVARIDDKTVFVSDALPGERVTLQRTARRRSFDEARLVAVIEPSGARVEPQCPHFGICGGCALQHLSPAAQLAFKQAQLLENLARIGGVAPREILPPLDASPWGYRRRARLGVKYVAKKGRVLVGFRERSAPYVADLHECRVLAAPAGELIDPLAALVQALSIAERVPQIEIAIADNGCALVLRVLAAPGREDLDRLAAFERERGVRVYLPPGGLDAVVDNISPDTTVAMVSLIGATAKTIELTVENKGLFEKVMAQQAQQKKKSPDDLRREYGMAAAIGIPALLGNGASAKTLGQAVARFITKPGRLAISAKTKDGGGLGLGDFASIGEPAKILEKLDITASSE